MALVSGGRSTLNPDAPLFVPAAYQQVEDFSPEWWQLVTTSSWYKDYWLSQHQDAQGFYEIAEDSDFKGNDVADLLPDSFDLDAGEYFSSLDVQDLVDPSSNVVDGFEAPKTEASLLKSLDGKVGEAKNGS